MAASNELKKIKKMYGEKFMKLCRRLFATILETEGVLYDILLATFSENCNTLYDDIINNNLENDFASFIFSKYEVKQMKDEEDGLESKTPYELLEEAGYDLIECTTEEEIQQFAKYYKEDEQLCTFRGGRLYDCFVFFAVRKDVDDIRRQNYKKPKREDAYGTSVMSIQFNKRGKCIVSIKNRYNHTVDNPDATYGNDLDKIISGLTKSFERLLIQRGVLLNNDNVEKFRLPNYIVASDGRYYRYNVEINGIYYCPGNIIIDNGVIIKLENPEREILIDYFILDLQRKKLQLYDPRIEDSFIDFFKNIEKIDIRKNIISKDKKIKIYIKNQDSPIIIVIDKNNQMIEYENSIISKIGNKFCNLCTGLIRLNLPNVTEVGDYFLKYNKCLSLLNLPNLQNAGHFFLFENKVLTEINLPKLREVGDEFLFYNTILSKLNLEKLEIVGDKFLYFNTKLKKVKFPNLHIIENDFLRLNEILGEFEAPDLEYIGENFMYSNTALRCVDLPNVEMIESGFLFKNEILSKFEAPKLEFVGESFLRWNKSLTFLDLPSLEIIRDDFLLFNEILSEIRIPKAKCIFDNFLGSNKRLTQIDLPCVEMIRNDFLYMNSILNNIFLPKVQIIGDRFLYFNNDLKELTLDRVNNIGDEFLFWNEVLSKINCIRLRKVGDNFLYFNNGLMNAFFPSLRQAGKNLLLNNKALKNMNFENLEEVGKGFTRKTSKMIKIKSYYLPKTVRRFKKVLSFWANETDTLANELNKSLNATGFEQEERD